MFVSTDYSYSTLAQVISPGGAIVDLAAKALQDSPTNLPTLCLRVDTDVGPSGGGVVPDEWYQKPSPPIGPSPPEGCSALIAAIRNGLSPPVAGGCSHQVAGGCSPPVAGGCTHPVAGGHSPAVDPRMHQYVTGEQVY